MRAALGFAGRVVVRLFKLVVVVIILVLLAVLVMGSITTQRGWPQTSGTISVKGLNRPVTVIRDYAGILQITADNPHDLFMAQGYAHAQERMWQMEVSRRIGAGRLAELFGKSAVDRDRYIRTLGWRDAAKRDLAAMAPETIAILQAYADGVNAWITEHEGRLSTPFVVAGLLSGTGGIGGYTLEPWTPLDTASWQKVQAWSLGGNVDSEIFRFLADARLRDPARTDELFPPYSPTAPVITPTGLKGSGGAAAAESAAAGRSTVVAAAAASLSADHATALGDLGRLGSSISAFAGLDRGVGLVGDHGVGSNNWVVSGEHTKSGKPILANDPHLGFGMPSVWIINGLHCRQVSDTCPWDVVGVTFPGAPAVVLGHNARIAWGATNVNPDTQDLFLINEDAADPQNYYVRDGQRLAYDVRHETIEVGGGTPVEFDVRSTVHGVVLSDVDKRLKDEDGPVLAMRWTTTAEVDLTLESFFRVNVADDFDEFRAAFEGYGSPSQNFVYADVEGHIGYVLPGLIPVRAGPDGLRVRDGGSSAEDWTGYVPREDLPWQLDPAGGQIVTANNAPVDDGYPYWLGSEWDPGFRAARVTELLAAAGDKLTLDAMREIQMDEYVLRSDEILPRLMATSPKPQTEDGKLLLARLAEWDGECDVASYGCAAYMAVEIAVERAIFDDELGPLARDYVGSAIAWQALVRVLGQSISPWWNVAGADTTPDPAGRVAEAIDATGVALRAAYGDPANWTWGNLHQVTFRESTLGSSGLLPLELYFNAQPRAVGGADGTVNNTYFQAWRAYPDPNDPTSTGVGLDELFDVAGGPSYRLVVDMSDLNGARIVITTGQSGNAFDPHSIDLIPLWAAGDSVLLPFSRVNVEANAAETLTLTPG